MTSLSSLIPKILLGVNTKKVLLNSGWLLGEKFVRLMLGLLVGVWVARHLGPEKYGNLAYALTFVVMMQSLVKLGLDSIVVRDISVAEESRHVVLGTTIVLRIVSGFVVLASVVLGLYLVGDHSSSLLVAIAGSSVIFQASDTIDLWFQSKSQSKRTVLSKLVSYSAASLLKVILILNDAPLWMFALVTGLEALFAAVAISLAYRTFSTGQRWIFSGCFAKRLLLEGWPFLAVGLSMAVYMRIDQIMIKEILGSYTQGVYAAVMPLSTLWNIVPVTLVTSLAPILAKKKLQSEFQYYKTLMYIFRGFSIIGWGVAIPMSVVATWVVPKIFGEEYAAGGEVLAIHVFTNVFICMGMAQSLWILNERKGKVALYRTVSGAIISVLLNMMLLARVGLIGAAIAAVVSQAFQAVLTNLYFSRGVLKMQIAALFFLPYREENITKMVRPT